MDKLLKMAPMILTGIGFAAEMVRTYLEEKNHKAEIAEEVRKVAEEILKK